MNKSQFLPEKYWSVTDERITIFKKYLNTLNFNDERLFSSEEIIEICINSLKSFSLTSTEAALFKSIILSQNSKVLAPSIDEICEQLKKTEQDEINIISLGCGDESVFERDLDYHITKKLAFKKLNWLGTDVGDYRGQNSFFNKHPFKIIEDPHLNYKTLISSDAYTVLVGRYSFHHLGIEFDEFLKRCEGLSKIILIEEPTTEQKWNIPDYRIMRIAYDILANTVFSIDWAKDFVNDSSKFKVNYIKSDALPSSCFQLNFKETFPETSLITVDL